MTPSQHAIDQAVAKGFSLVGSIEVDPSDDLAMHEDIIDGGLWTIVEIETAFVGGRWSVVKFVARGWYDHRDDLVLAITKDGIIKTGWLNARQDQHKTLDDSRYAAVVRV